MISDYPFSAIVGQNTMKQSLILTAIDPLIGGVLVFGERGTGKSTLARSIIRQMDYQSGDLLLHGNNISNIGRAEMRPFRTKVQMVFQDPFASLNPRIKVGNIISQGPIDQGQPRY